MRCYLSHKWSVLNFYKPYKSFNWCDWTLNNLLFLYRPSAKAILKHPFFWNREKQLAFFQVIIKRRLFSVVVCYKRLKRAQNLIVFSGRKWPHWKRGRRIRPAIVITERFHPCGARGLESTLGKRITRRWVQERDLELRVYLQAGILCVTFNF